MHYLEHNTATYTAKSGKTYTIYGSPVRALSDLVISALRVRTHSVPVQAAPFYSIGAFQYVAEDAQAIYARIPPSVDILMTHTPSHGVCDVTKRGKHAGCPKLAERLAHDDLKSCRLHLCGHIHEAHGVAIVGQSEQNPDGRVCVNAAMPVTPLPIIVDLKD